VVEGGVDRRMVVGDLATQGDERGDAAASRPAQPAVEGFLAGLALDGEDVAQAFLEQVGAVLPGVGLRDPGQSVGLVDGQGVGVLPERVAGVLQCDRALVPRSGR
jgi:hypothetical protein